MALTYTPTGELGAPLPEFDLPSVDGRRYRLKDFATAKALVIMFICNHCPYVKAIESRFIRLAAELKVSGVETLGICSNDTSEYPEDRPQALLARWREQNYGFPYLIDESQAVARSLGAVCTPDIYVYDSLQKLRYRGRFDDSWRKPEQVGRQELREAVELVLAGRPVFQPQNPAMGCSIKWK